MRTTEKTIHEKLDKFKRSLRQEWRFEVLAPLVSHVNKNETKSPKTHKLKFFKNPKQYFCEGTTENKFQEKLKKRFDGGVAFY